MTIPSAKDRAAEALSKLTDRGKPAAAPEPELIPTVEAAPAAPAIVEVGPMDLEPPDIVEPGMAYDRLNDKQRVFVDTLVSGKTQRAAAEAAGYGETRPEIAGSKLMRNPIVRKAVDERRAEAAEAAGIDVHTLLMLLADIAHGRTPVDYTIEKQRATETLLKYATAGKGGDTTSVARKINERFQKARLKALPTSPLPATKH